MRVSVLLATNLLQNGVEILKNEIRVSKCFTQLAVTNQSGFMQDL